MIDNKLDYVINRIPESIITPIKEGYTKREEYLDMARGKVD